MANVKSITPNTPADFTPEVGNYKSLQPFRYWCQKVLPLVYDDSLSYYELLCKVVDYLNKTMEDVETLHGDVTNIHTAYVELQSYVNNYFSSLDVQKEINNKLDNMASSGKLYDIIRKYTDPIVNEQNKQINVLKARMDTFASLPDGSTTGDAELTDIRVGYNEVVYPSAGDAVRAQTGNLYSEIGVIVGYTTETLFNVNKYINGKYDISTSYNKYGLYFNENTYVKSITPFFSNTKGSFSWRLLKAENGIVDGGITTVIKKGTGNIGDKIKLNYLFDKTIILEIYGNTESVLLYSLKSNSKLKTACIVNNGSAGSVLSQVEALLPYAFSGEFEIYSLKNILDAKDIPDITEYERNYLYGKKIVVIGDSMVYGHNVGVENTWLAKLAERNKMVYVNRGINGCCLSKNSIGENYPTSNSVYERVCNSTNASYVNDTEVDYILIFAGTNDAAKGVSIGEMNKSNNDATTFCGALNAICNELQTRYPVAKIGFITPYRRNDNYVNYANAIETMCELYSISVFNNIKNGGINWKNTAQVQALTLNDTYHLNIDGMKYASYKYENFIRSL